MEQNGMSVEDFIKAIKKRWKMICIITIVISGLVFTFTNKNYISKTEYKINSKIYVHNIEEDFSGQNNDEIQMGYYILLNNLIEKLNSKTFMRTVLEESNVNMDIDTLYKSLSVTLLKDSQVIKLEIKGNNKEECINILNAFENKTKDIAPTIIKNSKVEVIEKPMVLSEIDITKKNHSILLIILGAIGSVLLAFLLEYLDNSIKSEEQIQTIFKVPLLGKISSKSSDVVRQYANIRTNFKYSCLKNNKVILIMNNIYKEKNNDDIAKELALSLAKTQCKTLIINKEFKATEKGLIDVLEGKEILNDVISKENDYLYSMQLGNVINNNIDLLDSKLTDSLIEELKLEYDYLIIDSESLETSLESQILVAKSDSVVLVAKMNKTKIHKIEKLMASINYLNTEVMGIILK